MCGISGFWDWSASLSLDRAQSILKSMTDTLYHRGPDGAGSDYNPETGLGFGHRRLSIIDLSDAGHQPMQSANSRYTITYNGELYNTKHLRQALIALGKSFRGHSDTEVLIEYIDSFGIEKTLQDINGMFAFAAYDTHENMLILARDHTGIKPLYWALQNEKIVFASTLKPFMENPLFTTEMNGDCLHDYFTFNTIPAPQTILKDCYQLEPAHYAVFKKGQDPIIKQYWHVPNEADESHDFETLLKQSVKSQMVSDVPLGVFLSGGIDSSLVTALAKSVSAKPIKTFTIGFEESAHDESAYAERIANHLGTEHHQDILTINQTKSLIEKLPDFYDQPFADSSQLPSLLLCEMARKHATVCLSGDGADELFNGYDRYFYGLKMMRYADMPTVGYAAKLLGHLPLEKMIKRPANITTKLQKLSQMVGQNNLNDRYETLINLWMDNPSMMSKSDRPSFESMRHHDMHYYLPHDILHKMDRASMAHSLEVRVPYLDPRVIEAAFQTSTNQHGQKQILKDILAKYVPSDLFERPKSGFSVPIADWLRGDLNDMANDYFQKDKLEEGGYLNAEPILKKWHQHQAGTHNWQHALWGVLMLQLWRERYKL